MNRSCDETVRSEFLRQLKSLFFSFPSLGLGMREGRSWCLGTGEDVRFIPIFIRSIETENVTLSSVEG